MRFKVDENLPVEVAGLIREAGHEADTVNDERIGGAEDSDIAALCQSEQRALVTLDLDFADIRAYLPREYAGLVVLRLSHQDRGRVLDLCAQFVRLLEKEPLVGRLWIVEPGRVRIRSSDEKP